MRDRLTRLPGQRTFQRRLRKLLATPRDEGVGVLHIDLDWFQAVNQAIGRSSGDDVLSQAAQRLRGLRRPGCFIARLGSDRFAVLTDSPHAAMDLANQAIALLAEPFRVNDEPVAITASAGVAVQVAGATVSSLMSWANVALRWAKSDGRATCRRFEPARYEREVQRHQLGLALRSAMDGSPAVLEKIMQLGRALKLRMTAEGIETERQADLMRTLGCDTGQGWHFSRPMTANMIGRYLCASPTLNDRRRKRGARRSA